MSAEREELHRLVDELADQEVPLVLAKLRESQTSKDGAWPPSWFGAATAGRRDVSERVDELLAEGFARRS